MADFRSSDSAVAVSRKNLPGKLPPEMCPSEKLCPGKNGPLENCRRTIAPRQSVILDFCCF